MATKLDDDLNRDEPRHPKQVLFLTVDIPPSKNHAFFYKRGAKIMKKPTKVYMAKTKKEVCEKMKEQKWKKERDHVWYFADLYLYFPDKRRRDSHNSIEILMDTLQGTLFRDDYYVLPRIQEVNLDRENPRMEVVFYPINYKEEKKYGKDKRSKQRK